MLTAAVPISAPESVAPRAVGSSFWSRVDWLVIVQMLLLVVLPCACYWPSLNGAFLWDDDLLITKSPLIQSSAGLSQIWFSTIPFDYFPLTNTTFWVEWRLWGADPLGYHLLNFALHVTSSFLLWRLLRALQIPGAWFGALLFAVHPINVASVAWISERKNALSMVFYLGSLICHVRSEERPDGARSLYWAALGLFVLAALSKSSVVMLPCVLLLLVWGQTGKVNWRDLRRMLPFFAVSLAAGLLTIWFQYHRAITAENLAHANPPLVRLLVAGRAIGFYLGKIFWPRPLAMLYPRWEVSAADGWNYLWPVGVVAATAAVWWGRRFWGRGPAVALGTFVLGVLPISGLLHMSFFNYANVSDHLVYIAVPGILALVGAGLARWYGEPRNSSVAALIAMCLVAGLLCLGCFQRAEDFSSPEHLWRSTLEINPRCFAAHNNLGLVFQDRGRRDPGQLILAEGHFRQALKIDDQLETAGVNLANVLRMEGRWAQSAALYRRVLDAHPDADSFNNYGVSLLEMGDNTKAREAFYDALRLSPLMENAYYNLYGIELSEHHVPEACAMLRTCLRINPDSIPALTALVMMNVEQPDQPPLTPPAAEALMAMAERACQLTEYRSAQQLMLLSKATLAAGRRKEAADTAKRARYAAETDGQTDLVATIEQYQRTIQP